MAHLSNYATTITADDSGDMIVTYHNTAIVKFNSYRIILNMGGYDTVTTRKKMNQAAEQFNLSYRVYSAGKNTYIKNLMTDEHITLFADRVVEISRYSV